MKSGEGRQQGWEVLDLLQPASMARITGHVGSSSQGWPAGSRVFRVRSTGTTGLYTCMDAFAREAGYAGQLGGDGPGYSYHRVRCR